MGCVSSKQAVSVTPALDHSGAFRDNVGNLGQIRNNDNFGSGTELEKKKKKKKSNKGGSDVVVGLSGSELGESGRASSNCGYGGGSGNGESLSFRLGNLQKYVKGEQVGAGWPAWLSAVAGEAIQGWVPQRADSYEKLEKVFFLHSRMSI